jgi:hypothetical protein
MNDRFLGRAALAASNTPHRDGVEVNPAVERQTDLVGAVGKWMRELAPVHEQYWFDMYGRVALTGEHARFENRAKQRASADERRNFLLRLSDPLRPLADPVECRTLHAEYWQSTLAAAATRFLGATGWWTSEHA